MTWRGKRLPILTHIDGKTIAFGTGDITIHVSEDGKVLAFSERETPGIIGEEDNNFPPGSTINGLDAEVIFHFSDPRSIDALMRSLEMLKERF